MSSLRLLLPILLLFFFLLFLPLHFCLFSCSFSCSFYCSARLRDATQASLPTTTPPPSPAPPPCCRLLVATFATTATLCKHSEVCCYHYGRATSTAESGTKGRRRRRIDFCTRAEPNSYEVTVMITFAFSTGWRRFICFVIISVIFSE